MRPLPPAQDVGHVSLPPRSDRHARAKPQTAVEATPPPERVAVIVAHGVGQQVPFETLDLAVQGLQREALLRGESIASPGVGIAREGEETLQYASVSAAGREVHVYETYWAPLTEGKTGARDVLGFLVSGGINGLRNARRPFSRWMFGRRRKLPREDGTGAALGGAAVFLASLVALNVIIALAATGTWAGIGSAAVMVDLTWIALAYLLVAGAAGTVLVVAARANRRFADERAAIAATMVKEGRAAHAPDERARLVGLERAAQRSASFAAPMVWIALAATPVATLLMVAAIALPRFWWTLPTPPAFLITALWAALLGASVAARNLFVQYVGDVAAYVSSHKLDRYAELREAIKKRAHRIAKTVYAMKREDEPKTPLYSRVILVGHSLGSVVAYDTYNALVNDDQLSAPDARLDVVARTPLLLTFGSPLDKTAFIFGTTADTTTETREALAAVKQPIILEPELRPRAWVNVWSRRDIISGRLTFYAPTPGEAEANAKDEHLSDADRRREARVASVTVHNAEDGEARTPLLAHNEFWHTRRVWQTLRDAIDGEPVRSIPVKAVETPPVEAARETTRAR